MNREVLDETDPPAQKRWLAVGFILVALLAAGGLIAGGILMIVLRPGAGDSSDDSTAPSASPPPVTASGGRLTIVGDNADDHSAVSRREAPTIMFRVKLQGVVPGTTYTMGCEWIAPDGKIRKPAEFTIKPNVGPEWETHAQLHLTKDAPLGKWTARMNLDGRPVRSLDFEVKQ
jgi:hypothetical protein